MANKLTGGQGIVGALTVGGGTRVRKIAAGTFDVNPANLAANTKAATVVALAGVAAGDLVLVEPPAALEDDLIPAGVVCGAGQVSVYLYNGSGVAVDGAQRTWRYVWFDLTP